MLALAFAWLSAAAFALSLAFFLYSYFITFGTPGYVVQPALEAAAMRPAAVDVLLFSAFALHHSVFARTGVKALVGRLLAPAAERATYTFVSSVLFTAVCWWWQPVPGVVYSLDGFARWAASGVVATGLAITAIGARSLDVLDLAGVRQASGAASHRVRPGVLVTTGVYGFERHPLYFGWALVVFGVPPMSMSRLVFAVVSTIYLAIAIPFEERGLIETFGADYASYRRRVRWRMLPPLY